MHHNARIFHINFRRKTSEHLVYMYIQLNGTFFVLKVSKSSLKISKNNHDTSTCISLKQCFNRMYIIITLILSVVGCQNDETGPSGDVEVVEAGTGGLCREYAYGHGQYIDVVL